MSDTRPRLSAREAISLATAPGSFRALPPPPASADAATDGPLAWHGYDAMRERAAHRTGEQEAVVCGTALVGTTRVVLMSFEFGFLGGSLGQRAGDLVESAHVFARDHRLPVVSLVATGGSRMQEGMRALAQLQRVARQSARTRAAGLPQIAVLRDPCTGGGWATVGAGADITLALPGAQVGFAGARVRPADASGRHYTAEAQWLGGAVDALVTPAELQDRLGLWLSLLTCGSADPAPAPYALGRTDLPTTGWEAVLRARHPSRPRAADYLDAYFSRRVLLSGDRAGGGRDAGVLCGVGAHEGRAIAFVAQQGTATRPAGYRTATRLVRLAGRLSLPVLTLVDTPGAANDPQAEAEGVGGAIAGLFEALATAEVPVTTLVIGEGGSGGALALAAPDNTWVTPDSYFSVIAPESAAAILKRPVDDAPDIADAFRLRPQDVVRLGIARGIKGADGDGATYDMTESRAATLDEAG
ncbi:carboxyl transferase domain-containing protein [Streptomyces sp. NPDC048179]|uniref:carboxyl transferase domain-containing protein n=1 Tax=Streptomyces sp. NPDC048179 TaxID=3365506 RepID=UPI00371DA94B